MYVYCGLAASHSCCFVFTNIRSPEGGAGLCMIEKKFCKILPIERGGCGPFQLANVEYAFNVIYLYSHNFIFSFQKTELHVAKFYGHFGLFVAF